jgi:molybdopterin-containing oxidoreductase family iron-sulfur binding subunit
VILSLEADFLGSGPRSRGPCGTSPPGGRVEKPNRLYVVESTPTLTGARSDHRRPTPSEIEAFARAVAAAVGALPGGPAGDEFASAVAKDLAAHRGSGLVLAGRRSRRPCTRSHT